MLSPRLSNVVHVDHTDSRRRELMEFGVLPDCGFVRLPAVLAVFPVSRSAWWAGVKSGRFPTPVKLGPRITAWRDADIQRLIDAGIGAANDTQTPPTRIGKAVGKWAS